MSTEGTFQQITSGWSQRKNKWVIKCFLSWGAQNAQNAETIYIHIHTISDLPISQIMQVFGLLEEAGLPGDHPPTYTHIHTHTAGRSY